MKIYIYGTGSGAIRFYNSLNINRVKILGFLDSDKNKEGNKLYSYDILYPENIKYTDFDYIVIASEYIEIFDFLIKLGFNQSKIIQVYKFADLINKELDKQKIISKISNRLYEKYVITKRMFYEKDNYLEREFDEYFDYSRYKTLQLVANEIYSNNIQGSVAEVGVYRGDFAKIINSCFKDRKLFLFDTFEGFNEKEKEYDLINNYTTQAFLNEVDFKDTNVDEVLEKMKYIDNCIVRKGYFPDTAIDITEKFVFVSIDVDLYEPIYNALEFFYPKMNEGGYIFLHDYNNRDFFGVKKAIKNFEDKYGKMKKVPLCDSGGTLVITK